MTVQTKTVLKGFFNDGDLPVEANYVDLIDSMVEYPDLSSGAIDSLYLGLPGLRSYYPMGANTIFHASDLANGYSLQDPASLAFYTITNELAPCVRLNGSSSYFYFTDSAHFEISGTEAQVAATYRGLTVGAWIKLAELPSVVGMMGIINKWLEPSNCAYRFYAHAGNYIAFTVSEDGTKNAGQYVGLANSVSLNLDDWFFAIARYSKAQNKIFVTVNDTTEEASATTITQCYASGSANFEIGRHNQDSNDIFSGWLSRLFISCMYLPESMIQKLYLQTKSLYQL